MSDAEAKSVQLSDLTPKKTASGSGQRPVLARGGGTRVCSFADEQGHVTTVIVLQHDVCKFKNRVSASGKSFDLAWFARPRSKGEDGKPFMWERLQSADPTELLTELGTLEGYEGYMGFPVVCQADATGYRLKGEISND